MRKLRLEDVREQGLLDAWASGDMERGLPAVILGDLKTRYTEQYPFSVLYDELHRRLSHESLVVVGGYSFGDRPLNRALARFLCRDPRNRLVVWNPSLHGQACTLAGSQAAVGQRAAFPISGGQVIMEQVLLPDAAAVRRLGDATTAGASR